MRRIIEILKMFQNGLEFVSLPYLVEKFSLTVRTLQKDLQRINRLLGSVSNCKIIKNKDQLLIIGNNPKGAINDLLNKLLKTPKSSQLVRFYQLIFYHICESQPLTNAKLLNFSNSTFYDLKQEISLINSCLNYYDLDLKLKFKTKQGWFLVGSELDLRLLAIKVLINQLNHPLYPNNSLDPSLLNLHDKLITILLNIHFYDYFFKEIVWYLIIIIKRIKLNKLLNNYFHPLLLKILVNNKVINNNFNKLAKILEQQISLKFSAHESIYFKSLMLLNQKNFNNDTISNLIQSLSNLINQLIFEEYQLLFAIKKFKVTLKEFLKGNILKLLFNFYQEFNFNSINECSWGSSYWYGWEIINIIVFALKKFKINLKFRLLISDYLLMIFNDFYLENKEQSWKVPLFYQTNDSFSHQSKKMILFIKNSYKNITLKSLNIDNNYYKNLFLNKNYALLIDYQFNDNLLPLKNLFLINNNHSNQQLRQNLDFTMKKILIDKIRNSILIFQFFLNQKFSSIKSFLTYLQQALVRKFKLNSLNFQLKDGFINSNYLLNKILIVHKLVSKDNVNLPIILIYLKSPLIFHKKFPINFIFVLINSSDTLYQYQGLTAYVDVTKNSFNSQVKSVMNLYQIIDNFLL